MSQRDRNGMAYPRRRRRRRGRRARLFVAGAAAVGLLLMGARWVVEQPAGDGYSVTVRDEMPTPAVPSPSPAAPAEDKPDAGDGYSITMRDEVPTPAVPSLSPAPPAEDKPDAGDWRLLLVNPWNPLPEGYEPALATLKNGLSVDERCYPALQEMMDGCRAAGLSPVICSAYRSQEKQERLYQNQVDKLLARGFAREEAEAEAARAVAVPGTSEHQTGLAVDIVDVDNQNLNESQEDTAVQKWLMENSWKYGFILRYPNEKSDTTGIIYEPWHYRYVGADAAKAIHEQGLCLEEYLSAAPSA